MKNISKYPYIGWSTPSPPSCCCCPGEVPGHLLHPVHWSLELADPRHGGVLATVKVVFPGHLANCYYAKQNLCREPLVLLSHLLRAVQVAGPGKGWAGGDGSHIPVEVPRTLPVWFSSSWSNSQSWSRLLLSATTTHHHHPQTFPRSWINEAGRLVI